MDVLSGRGGALARAALWAALAAALAASSSALAYRPPSLSPDRAAATRADLDQAVADGHWTEALYLVRKLQRAFPEDSVYWRRGAQVYAKLGDFPSEARCYELAMKLSPTPTENCPYLGRAYADMGRRDLQLDADRRCLDADPTNVDMMLFYALSLERAGRLEEAEALLARLVERSPTYTDAVDALRRVRQELRR